MNNKQKTLLIIFKILNVYNIFIDPKSYNVKTGVANVMTNKGAIGISLQFDALTFLFVNSHLTGN